MKVSEKGMLAFFRTCLANYKSCCLIYRVRIDRKAAVNAAKIQFPLRLFCSYKVLSRTALASIYSFFSIGIIFVALSSLFEIELNSTSLLALNYS